MPIRWRSLRLAAEHQGDLPWLKLALEHVLLHPEQDWSELAGPRYPFNSREMVQMIDYIYKTIWPDAKLPDSRSRPRNVELVPMSFEECAATAPRCRNPPDVVECQPRKTRRRSLAVLAAFARG